MNGSFIDFKHREVTPQVTVLKMSHQFMINYNYLVVDPITREAVVIDPAWQIEKIDQALADARATLSGILLTHSHLDHVHLVKPLVAKYNCPIWMSNEEIDVSGYSAEQLVGIDESPWTVGRMLIEPILTPGHTPGCICYQISDNLFTGDVLFAEGCGICPDIQAAHDMYASLDHLKSRLKPHTRIFPGHSYGKQPGRIFSQVLQENIYLQFKDKESFAAFRLRSGQNKSKMFNFR